MLTNYEGLWREKKTEEHSDSTIVGQKVLEPVKGDPKRQDTGLCVQEWMHAQAPKDGANVFLKMLRDHQNGFPLSFGMQETDETGLLLEIDVQS